MYLTLPDLHATGLLAVALAGVVREGDVVELEGDLGAGKTTFVGMLARALGSGEAVRSPTYTVAHEYALAGGGVLAHLDCYRTPGELDEAAWGDVEPYFDRGIACVEWPDAVRPWIARRPCWNLRLRAARGAVDADAPRIARLGWQRIEPERVRALVDAVGRAADATG